MLFVGYPTIVRQLLRHHPYLGFGDGHPASTFNRLDLSLSLSLSLCVCVCVFQLIEWCELRMLMHVQGVFQSVGKVQISGISSCSFLSHNAKFRSPVRPPCMIHSVWATLENN